MKKPLALVTAGALLAAPIGLVLAGPASADTERNGALAGGGRYSLSVDREDRGFEVQVDLDDVAPGSRWKVVLRQDGKQVVKQILVADGEGDVDLERYRPDTAGSDVFKVVVTNVATGAKVRSSIIR